MNEFVQEIIKEAGYIAKRYYEKGVKSEYKSSLVDVVTVADREVNDFLVKKIREKYPEHGIISEEEKEEINPGAEYTWVMDPIDGTRNFAKHIAFWCTMIGITKNGVPYIGAIYDAINDELFFAEKDKGAFLNGRQIRVDNYKEIEHNFLVFSGGMNSVNGPYDAREAFPRYKKFGENLIGEKGFWIQNYGSSLSIAHLAAGRIDSVVVNVGLYHDYLAPLVIATEAGAKWTNSKGQPWQRGEMDIVVANPDLHVKLLGLFK
jgi:myo-inositol-1(or 4)-monophosphatase